MGPVSSELKSRGHEEIIVRTGQHKDPLMSDIFFVELELREPDVILGNLSDTGKVLREFEPDIVLVYGDTISTMIGAFYAKQEAFPVVHIEAGLRSGNKRMVEEAVRIMVDASSDILCCPTRQAVENLINEGVDGTPFLTGDVLRECLFRYLDKAVLPKGVSKDSPYILASIHRAENTDDTDRLRCVFNRIIGIAIEKQLSVIFPMHPRTKQNLYRLCYNLPPDIQAIGPVSYFEMLALEQFSDVIITDSGGVQREAYWLDKNCIVMRDETEWEEIDNGEIESPSRLIVDIMESVT